MNLTRRQTLMIGATAVAAAALPDLTARASTADAMDEAIRAFTGGADMVDGGIDISAPEIAENGNTVPVEVSADGATAILLLAAGNPNPGVAKFSFGKLSGSSAAKTRIRLAGTQDLIAIAKLKDGSFARASRSVKVTIGGCGG
ncbi:MAG: thiosulfate oxidation carrier protein SoxY [Pseudomonadota bacterium]